MSDLGTRRRRWMETRPWQTNLALCLIGLGLVCLTRQFVSELDEYTIGMSAVAAGSLVLYGGAILLLLLLPGNTNRYTFAIVVAVAIMCRVVPLFNEPISTDIYRYAWDGVVQHAHINPYRYVPGNPALTFLREPNSDLFDSMNRRDYAVTIYPPVAQIAFYLITFFSPTMLCMKLAMILFEGLMVYGLVLLLRRLGLRREWVLFYAWCPLCIWEFGSSGHVDAMLIAFMVLAFLFRYRRQPALTGLFLGLAIFTKFYPLVLFPALYQRRRDGRLDWKMPAMIAAVGVASYSLYLSAGARVFGFLGGYVQEEGIANGTRYFPLELMRSLPGLHDLPNAAYGVFVACVFLALTVYAWGICSRHDSAPAVFLNPAMYLAFTLMLLFSPHYPWYIAWLVPFLVLRPNLTLFTYVFATFYLRTTALASGQPGPEFQLNQILYGVTLIAACLEFALHKIPRTRSRLQALTPYAFHHPGMGGPSLDALE